MKKIRKWITNKVIGMCEFQIIMCKNLIKLIELLNSLGDMNDSFNQKIKKK